MRRFTISAILAAGLLCAAWAIAAAPSPAPAPSPATAPATTRPFAVFDATLYRDRPAPDVLRARGLLPALCDNRVKEADAVAYARRWDALVVIDEEPRPQETSRQDVAGQRAVAAVARMDRCRTLAPELAWGVWNAPMQPKSFGSPLKQVEWPEADDARNGIMERLGYSAPAVYLHPGENIESWRARADVGVAYARKFNRPIFVFVNPDYFNRKGDAPSEHLCAHDFGDMIDHLRGLGVDGVVIWGGWTYAGPAYTERPWWDSAPWLAALAQRGLYTPPAR